MNTPTPVSLRIPMFIKVKVEENAIECGVNKSDFYRDAIFLYAVLSPSFHKRLENLSAKLGSSEGLIVENLILSWMARKEAEEEVWGKNTSPLKEFMYTKEGPVTGEALFDILKQDFKKEEETRKRDFDRRKREDEKEKL
jgi:hypothetical protein